MEHVAAAIEPRRRSAGFPRTTELYGGIGVIDDQLVRPGRPHGAMQAHERNGQDEQRTDSTCAWSPLSRLAVQHAGRSAIHTPAMSRWFPPTVSVWHTSSNARLRIDSASERVSDSHNERLRRLAGTRLPPSRSGQPKRPELWLGQCGFAAPSISGVQAYRRSDVTVATPDPCLFGATVSRR